MMGVGTMENGTLDARMPTIEEPDEELEDDEEDEE